MRLLAITFSAVALFATTAAMPAYAEHHKDHDGSKRIENQAERRAHHKEKWDAMTDDEKAAHKAKAKERWQHREGDKTRIDDRVERRDDRRDERKTAPRIER
ncbi:MAG: hypothetical protein FJX23_08215 [Alphaproteobacteria bacterium]|nr:hypothetical protein [Alphaproteobacteria bacterium]